MSIDDINYHAMRAKSELDRGLIASGVQAAHAHLRLSSLHLDKLRELKGDRSEGCAPLSL